MSGLLLMDVGTRAGVRFAVTLAPGPRLVLRGDLEAELPFDPGDDEGLATLRTRALAAICGAFPRLDPARVSAPDEPGVGPVDAVLDAVRSASANPRLAIERLRPGDFAALLARAGWAVVRPPGAAARGAEPFEEWVSPDGQSCLTLGHRWTYQGEVTIPCASEEAHRAELAFKEAAEDYVARTWAALATAAKVHGTTQHALLVTLLASPPDPSPPRAPRLVPRQYTGPDSKTCCGKGCDLCAFVPCDGWECEGCRVVGQTPASIAHAADCNRGAP